MQLGCMKFILETRTGNLCDKYEIEFVIFKNATTETGL
jgi:hypothetical protein